MSIWNIEEIKTNNEKLTKYIEVEILIIGGGITGMTTAYYLRHCPNICLVDASKIGHGVTLNTTAKINYFQDQIYSKIAKSTNKRNASKYLESQLYAIDNLRSIIEKEKITCDLKKVPSYVYANKKSGVKSLEKNVSFFNNNGCHVYKKELPKNIKSYTSYCVDDTYIFNPLKYLQGIYNILKEKNIPIYENTKITKIKKRGNYYECFNEYAIIKAKRVIMATHYPYFTLPFLLPFKSYIEKSYIIISKVDSERDYTFISYDLPNYSCRFYTHNNQSYQISLGQSHNTAFKQDDKNHLKKIQQVFKIKEEDIVESYSNVDIMTLDHMPYIGLLKKNFYLACGYNTWGMTNAILAAKIISDNILNEPNKYAKIFSPKRFNLSSLIGLPLIVFSQTKSFLGSKVNKKKSWYESNIKFYYKDGLPLATYYDEVGNKHTICNKCPHLGCSLLFNEVEKTWDCPCHSSRFDLDGKCIKGPSNYDISYKE